MDVFPALVGVGVGHTVPQCVTREGQAGCLPQRPQHFHPHRQCVGVPASAHPHQHVFLSSFHPGRRDAVSPMLRVCVSLTTSDPEHWPLMYLLWRSVCADTLTRICLFLKIRASDSARRLPESSVGVAAFVATPLSRELDENPFGETAGWESGCEQGRRLWSPCAVPAVGVAGGPGTPRLSPSARACPWLSTGVPARDPSRRSVLIPRQTRGVSSPCVVRSLKYSDMSLPGVADCAKPRTDPFCCSAVLPPADPQHLQGRCYWQRCFCVYIHIFRMSPWAKAPGQERACPGKEATVPRQ